MPKMISSTPSLEFKELQTLATPNGSLHFPPSLRGSIRNNSRISSAKPYRSPEAISLYCANQIEISKGFGNTFYHKLSARRLLRRKFNSNDITTSSRVISPLLAMTNENDISVQGDVSSNI
jgi:hypothetical protein